MARIGISRMLTSLMRFKIQRIIGFLLLTSVAILVIDLSGVLRHLQEKSYEREFAYPLETPNFSKIVEAFRLGEKVDVPPINNLYSSIHINAENVDACPGDHEFELLVLIKSAPFNFKQRQAIRETWKVSTSEWNANAVFFVGYPKREDANEELVGRLKDESSVHRDIVHLKYEDSYYNNTIKTMLEMRWAVEMCPGFHYALLVDDDYYVSLKNVLKFTENPSEYSKPESLQSSSVVRYDSELDRLYAGYRMFPPPHRHKILTKWFLPLEEYPYDYFPPYITAGAILLSKAALFDIYYSSFYTAHFRFDDIYVAICAKKMNITPVHSEHFRFWSIRDESPEEFLVASHGFSDAAKLFRFWHTQKSLGYC